MSQKPKTDISSEIYKFIKTEVKCTRQSAPLPNPTYSIGIWSWFAAHRPPTNKPTWEGLGLRDQEGLVFCKHSPICLTSGADDRKLSF